MFKSNTILFLRDSKKNLSHDTKETLHNGPDSELCSRGRLDDSSWSETTITQQPQLFWPIKSSLQTGPWLEKAYEMAQTEIWCKKSHKPDLLTGTSSMAKLLFLKHYSFIAMCLKNDVDLLQV